MEALSQVRLASLMANSTGSSSIAIGVIDGPVDLKHEAFATTKIRTTRERDIVVCKMANSVACMHGTFVTGILTGKRGLPSPAICPDCEIILRPIFSEESHGQEFGLPSATPDELAQAIIECIDAGANIINLSVGLSTSSLKRFHMIDQAYSYALQKGVPMIASSGNQGQVGYISILDNPWIIPVVSCDNEGRPDPSSNTNRSIAKYGLMAPGNNITSISAGGGFKQLSGTSFAAAFVSGAIALLWSIFKNATAQDIVLSMRGLTTGRSGRFYPPLCDVEKSYTILENTPNSR